MRSCLYSCEVIHKRLWPLEHEFKYRIFMFYLDLDEDLGHLKLFSKNRFNWFSYFDKDHHNISPHKGRITLLTNVRMFGYVFNPISFFLFFDEDGKTQHAIAEVTNTHRERKLYKLDDSLRLRTPKNFYVSPFSDLDTEFDFIFEVPSSKMHMRVDDYKNGQRILLSSVSGERKELTDKNLLLYGLTFPLMTVKIIALIYWQALKLKLKGLPFSRKNENIHLQKDYVKI